MLPEAQDRPASRLESCVGFAITFDVAVEFRLPELAICARLRSVLRASMPEAAVNEHGYPLAREDNVRADWAQVGIDSIVLPETRPGAMQLRSQAQLRFGVRP